MPKINRNISLINFQNIIILLILIYKSNELKNAIKITKDNQISLTEEFKEDLNKSNNPQIVLVTGPTRCGKSTTLNNVLINKQSEIFDEKNLFKLNFPFKADGGLNAVTKHFSYFGPISKEKLMLYNKIHIPENFKDADYFIIDSEGSFNLDGDSENLFQTLFSMQGILSYLIYIEQGVPNGNTLSIIKKQLYILEILNKEIKLNLPDLIIIANKISKENKINNQPIKEKIFSLETLNLIEKEKIKNILKTKDSNINFDIVLQWNIDFNTFNDDIKIYWNSINKLVRLILKENTHLNNVHTGKELISNFELSYSSIKEANLTKSVNNINNLEELFSIFIKNKINKVLGKQNIELYNDFNNIIHSSLYQIPYEELSSFHDQNNDKYITFTSKIKEKITETLKSKLPKIEDISKDLYESKVNDLVNDVLKKMYKEVDKLKTEIEKKREEEKEIESKKKALKYLGIGTVLGGTFMAAYNAIAGITTAVAGAAILLMK